PSNCATTTGRSWVTSTPSQQFAPCSPARAKESEVRMSETNSTTLGPRRLWLPVILVVIQAVLLRLPYWVEIENMDLMFGLFFLTPMVATGGVLLWWLLLSGLPWRDRLLGVVVAAVAGGAAFGLADESFRMALQIYGLAALSTVWIGYLLLTTWLSW